MKAALIVVAALFFGLVSGCDDEPERPFAGFGSGGGSSALSASAGETTAAGVGGAGGSVLPDRIVVDATEGELPVSFGVTIAGEGSSFVGAIDLAPMGSIELGGEVFPAITYEKQPFPPYTLYQAMAAGPDRLFIVWTYCEMGEVVGVYYEGTDGTDITYEPATGTCSDEVDAPSALPASLPAIDMPLPALIDGYFADGPQIHLDGASPGWVALGETLVVLPFAEVDCTKVCGDPGWRELHTLLWDPENKRVCFAIFYFFAGDDTLFVTYSLTLPDLSDPAGQTALSAQWTAP